MLIKKKAIAIFSENQNIIIASVNFLLELNQYKFKPLKIVKAKVFLSRITINR